MPRLFVSIPIPHTLRDALVIWQRAQSREGIRLTTGENLHITVAFLDVVEETDVDALAAALAATLLFRE